MSNQIPAELESSEIKEEVDDSMRDLVTQFEQVKIPATISFGRGKKLFNKL
jgi:hypothetical protein